MTSWDGVSVIVGKITDPGSGAPDTNGGNAAEVLIDTVVPAGALLDGNITVPDTPGRLGSEIATAD